MQAIGTGNKKSVWIPDDGINGIIASLFKDPDTCDIIKQTWNETVEKYLPH